MNDDYIYEKDGGFKVGEFKFLLEEICQEADAFRYSNDFNIKKEQSYITELQKATYRERIQEFKEELIDDYFVWLTAQVLELQIEEIPIAAVFWDPKFDKFVDYAKSNNIRSVNNLMFFDFYQLCPARGFHRNYKMQIVDTFKSWCENVIKMYRDTNGNVTNESVIDEIVNEFYK